MVDLCVTIDLDCDTLTVFVVDCRDYLGKTTFT
jgi:hypothetical protein